MTTTAERLALMSEVRLFSECSPHDLEVLDRLADEVEVDSGTVFVREGHYSRDAYIVVSGKARVEREGRQIGTVGPGGCIGELSIIEPGLRTATVVADGTMVVLAMNGPQFLTALEEVGPLARDIMRSLAKRLREEIGMDDGLV